MNIILFNDPEAALALCQTETFPDVPVILELGRGSTLRWSLSLDKEDTWPGAAAFLNAESGWEWAAVDAGLSAPLVPGADQEIPATALSGGIAKLREQMPDALGLLAIDQVMDCIDLIYPDDKLFLACGTGVRPDRSFMKAADALEEAGLLPNGFAGGGLFIAKNHDEVAAYAESRGIPNWTLSA